MAFSHFCFVPHKAKSVIVSVDAPLVTGPDATPLEKAKAYIATATSSYPYNKDISTMNKVEDVHIGRFFYPRGSVCLFQVEASTDAFASFPNIEFVHLPAQEFDASLPCHDSFFDDAEAPLHALDTPTFFSASVQHKSLGLYGSHPLWDCVAFGVLLGAVKAAGRVPYDFRTGRLDMSFYALAGSAVHALRPWVGDPSIPSRGAKARPFSKNATTFIAAHGLTEIFNSQCFALYIAKGVLRAETECFATHLVPGMFFEEACARFPNELISAGEAVWPHLETPTWTNHPKRLLTRDLKHEEHTMSAHQRLAVCQQHANIDARLRALAPDFARPIPRV